MFDILVSSMTTRDRLGFSEDREEKRLRRLRNVETVLRFMNVNPSLRERGRRHRDKKASTSQSDAAKPTPATLLPPGAVEQTGGRPTTDSSSSSGGSIA